MSCFHCGEQCEEIIEADHKSFCCEGCKQVYLLLNENNLCTYYNFDKNPGIKAKGKFVSERFAYLDDIPTVNKLVQFSSGTQTNVTFSLPQMHCSSCVFLLENLHRIEPGVTKSQVNFQRKEVFIIFNPLTISLRKVVELLAFIGYEPDISLKDSTQKKAVTYNKKQIYHIGIAGFCFANIMMLSFPEYFSSGNIEQAGLKATFTWLNLFLSLPVLLFSASSIFISAWKGLRQKFLNIDAPIALAIIVTFSRSYYEIITGHGAGYLDSGTGIVFFMLVGRWFQNKTYDSFAFDRDYKSYFPLGVTVIQNNTEKNIPVTQLKKDDRIIIRNGEMIPADAMLLTGNASVDYSFVSGESSPIQKYMGELIYAGGKQCGAAIELQIINEVSQSYITQLWNNDVFKHKKNKEQSFIHPWSRYFTLALFSVAIITAIYWSIADTSKLLPAVTAVLIVACPCSLLLSATFTYGNMLRIFGKHKLFLKNAAVIESMAKADTLIFDKTGTLTQNHASALQYNGTPLSKKELATVQALTRQSAHPLSKIITDNLGNVNDGQLLTVNGFKEFAGKGIEAVVNDMPVKIGSAAFVDELYNTDNYGSGSQIHVQFNKVHMGAFTISNQYRPRIKQAVTELQQKGYELHLLSGDNDTEKNTLTKLFGKDADIRFNQSPQNKLDTVQQLQSLHKNVLMFGDGLNDAGALMQSDTGIAVSDSTTQFSPACDAIIDGSKVGLAPRFLAYARAGKKIVAASFILSIIYNFVGLSFAVQGTLAPIVAAILMPASSISIVLLVTLLSSLVAKKIGLK
ncbi:heavy metal translocating P-type ATPase metal-binding domain-containing protein [Ferruginibacter paludis]|uniref:heavy metal translocating P-type ATPase n=1 Tax=Ferruginibacter paludis TaxID=1310417 RepID=UPI0025B3679B|nr:heavy metal translocating P-type ATPase metal-binding domain-containing protein [Ferruginibacter paludis]MDN3655639.1 heavy metal translocating P-type ATPase metal-binding domain-containing protein [Ferruginibacter paludis]